MIVKINDRYIDTDSIEFISRTYLKSNTNSIKTYAFNVYLKNRANEIVFVWDMKTYNAETPDSLIAKIDIIRDKLAKMIGDVVNLDSAIELRKKDVEQLRPARKGISNI